MSDSALFHRALTGETELVSDREQVINDRTPAVFNFTTGDTTTFEAQSSAGAVIPNDFIVAFRNMDPVPVECDPALADTAEFCEASGPGLDDRTRYLQCAGRPDDSIVHRNDEQRSCQRARIVR